MTIRRGIIVAVSFVAVLGLAWLAPTPTPSSRVPGALAAPPRARSPLDVEALDEHLRALDMAHAEAQVVVIGHSAEGRPLQALHLGRRSGTPRPAVWVQSSLHGREWLATSLAVDLARDLLGDERALEGVDVWLLPLANPDGYDHARRAPRPQGPGPARLWRKNRRCVHPTLSGPHRPGPMVGEACGVDLNRNFDCDWPDLGDDESMSNVYRGPSPASEPEVRAVQDLLERRSFALGLDVHTGGGYELHFPSRVDRDARPAEPLVELAITARRAFEDQDAPHRWGPVDGGSRFFCEASRGGQAVNYFHHRCGMASFTLEIGRFFGAPPAADAERLLVAWRATIRAMIARVRSGPGISAVIRSDDARPLAATLTLSAGRGGPLGVNHAAWRAPTHRETGRLHRLVEAGRYRARIEAIGHEPRDVEIDVGERGWTEASFELVATR